MAAAGGGKIRSRRYHIASKPYAKGKQQQSGLISRVTDTVKSIVPSWLQKYFNNGDAAEEGTSVQTTEENCQPPPPNGSEEGPPTLDGRDSPEPEPSTTNTEPSTSRATLNFQENMLSRPPLSRSHLHLTPLDTFSSAFGGSSSMFSQPSTSSAPGPFSTGYSLVKEIKDNLSVHEDDNISTTSGFSSRASDKDVPTSKTSSLPQLWSPETDRTQSGPQPSQSSLKKPAFNLSVFRTSSNSSLNSTVLNSSQLGDSPFYPGKTMYGGASAVRSSRTRPGTPYQAPVRRQIKAKPAGTQPCGVTSATARRILQSLERMSSPLADAKRIPAGASPFLSPSLQTMDDINMDVSNHQPKKKKMEPSLPPVQKLVVPVTTPVSGNRSVSFRPTLTPGGMSRAVERAARETPARQSPLLPEATPGQSLSTMGSSEPVYPLSSTPAAGSSAASGGGKIKRERTTARPSSKHQDIDEIAEAPDLPTIPLPIRTSALPSFNFSSPLPPLTTTTSISSTSKITATTPAKESLTNKDPPKASTPPSVPFTFSSPIVKATAASPSSFSPSAGFTFSAPVAKLGPSISNGKLAVPSTAAVRSTTNKSTEDFEGPFKPAKALKQGSVIDILRAPEFASPVAQVSPSPKATTQPKAEQSTAPTTTTLNPSSSAGFAGVFKASTDWTCDVCWVPNKLSDTKCVCCAAPQPNSSSKSTENKQSPAPSVGQESSSTNNPITTTTGFGTLFSKPTGTWDCDTCLVINKPDAVKCVACETAKPGTGLKPSLTLPSAFSAVKTLSTPAVPASTGFTGFGDKFKKPEGAWECDTCMVQNKAEDTKCVACTSPKPGASADATSSASSTPVFGLGDKFKKPEDAWDCDVCLVQNKAADSQCVACQSNKPGASVEPKAFSSSFGTPAGETTLGSSTSTSGGFKFGTSDIPEESTSGIKFGGSFMQASSSTSGFKFGVPFGTSTPESSSKDNAASSGFKFGSSSEGFKFGAALNVEKKSDQPAAGPGFKFGSSGGIVFGTGSSSTDSNPSKGGFTFGLSKPEEKTSDTSTCPSSVNFTSDQPAQEKSSETSSNDITSTNSNTVTTTNSAGLVFGRLGEATSASQGSAAFGSLQANKEPAGPTFSFGKTEEKKDVAGSTVPSNFSFGAANQEADPTLVTTGGFSFNKPSAPTEQPPPAFTFGKPADKSEIITSDAPKHTFSFGQSAADSAAPKPAFSFRAGNPVNSTSSTTASSSTPTPSLFGGSSSTTTTSSISSTSAPAPSATPNTFMFGQLTANANSAPPAKAFCFGQSQDSQPPAATSAALNSTSAPAPAQPFIFGAPANAAPPAAAPAFGFGAAAPSAASSSAPSTAPTPFTFSSAASGGFGANQAPSFGSSFGSPFSATPPQAPGFGAKANAAPVFGQQTNSTPVFGGAANSAPESGGFQFGGSGGFGAANNTSGVFTFGAGAAGSTAPASNPSIAPQSATPGSGFPFNQPPAFNMGSNKSFTASPVGQQAIAGRKIKTAVRRRK